jgi:hypothetical protein
VTLFTFNGGLRPIGLLSFNKNSGGAIMDEDRGGITSFFGSNAAVLFFILVFLLLFWGCTGPACDD